MKHACTHRNNMLSLSELPSCGQGLNSFQTNVFSFHFGFRRQATLIGSYLFCQGTITSRGMAAVKFGFTTSIQLSRPILQPIALELILSNLPSSYLCVPNSSMTQGQQVDSNMNKCAPYRVTSSVNSSYTLCQLRFFSVMNTLFQMKRLKIQTYVFGCSIFRLNIYGYHIFYSRAISSHYPMCLKFSVIQWYHRMNLPGTTQWQTAGLIIKYQY